jgi:4-amino-4-deoxy-L-arabinose transferase-like glycosyltransferase
LLAHDSATLSRRWGIALAVVILLGAAARLIGLDGPQDDHHWYRQVETAAMARNFAEGGMNLLRPQVDWGGETPGDVESEFPIYAYLVAAVYQVTGPQEWVARLVNVGIYALSALLLFALTRRVYDDRAGLAAVGFYTVLPISYFFTRDIQGDALASLGTIAGVYFFWAWTTGGRWADFALSALGTAVAVLIKPSNLYLGLPLCYLLYARYGFGLVRQWRAWVYAGLVVAPMWLWYTHAYHLWEAHGNTLFRAYVGLTLTGLNDFIWLSFGNHTLQRLVWALATPAGVILLGLGVLSRPPRGGYVLHWWAAGFVVSMVLAPEPHTYHDYYQLPLCFVLAAFMGRGLTRVLDRDVWAPAVAAGLAVLAAGAAAFLLRGDPEEYLPRAAFAAAAAGIAGVLLARGAVAPRALAAACVGLVLGSAVWEAAQFYPNEPWQRERAAFGRRVQELTDPGEKVVYLSVRPHRPGWFQHVTRDGEVLGHDCADFYLGHRKGWSLGIDQTNPAKVEALRGRGARYLCYFLGDFPFLLKRHPDPARVLGPSCRPVEVTPRWAIYRLVPPGDPSGN